LLAELRTDGGPTSFSFVAPLQRSSRRLRPPALIDCDAMVNLITADWLAGGPFISCKKYAYAVRRITETRRVCHAVLRSPLWQSWPVAHRRVLQLALQRIVTRAQQLLRWPTVAKQEPGIFQVQHLTSEEVRSLSSGGIGSSTPE